MKSKHDLVNLARPLSDVECKYPVEEWRIKGIQFWPILKIIIYSDRFTWKPTFKSIFAILLDRKSFQAAIPKILNRLGWNKPSMINAIGPKSLPKAKLLFSGKNIYRVALKNEYWNRYFDPIMDEVEEELTSFMIDYSNERLEPLYKEYRSDSLISHIKTNKSGSKINIDSFYQCEGFNDALAHLIPFFNGNEKQLLKKITKKLKTIIEFKSTWSHILEQVEPDIVFCLCYYNEPMFGLLLAAKEKGIPTVDMQHGGQGVLHPAYHFSCSEGKSYNILPDIFWVWESSAAKEINSCFKTTHRAFIGGNPWITHLISQLQNYPEIDELKKRKIIVCTLTWGLESILPEFLLSAILKSSSEYEWWLRFHPNTPHSERQELAKIVENNRIEDRVEIIRANEWPLPILLKIAWAHVSHWSGSLFEASIIGLRRNIIINEVGANNFRDLISESKAFYYNPTINKESLIDFAENLNISDNNIDDCETFNYAASIHGMIEQFKKNT